MTTWKRLDEWVGTQVEDQFVMIHLESGRYVALNESAAETWNTLEAPTDSEGIVAALTAKFEVDEATCRATLGPLLEQMHGLGLIAPVA